MPWGNQGHQQTIPNCPWCHQPKKLTTINTGGHGFGSKPRQESGYACTNPECTPGIIKNPIQPES
jgi:hypothetical protein